MKTSPDLTWLGEGERGNARLIAGTIGLVTFFGYRFGLALLVPITAFYTLTSSLARRSSREYLARALGRPVNIALIYRHLFVFAANLLDRVFFLARPDHDIRVDVEGVEHLSALVSAGRGGVLMGAHLGCFEAVRSVSVGAPVVVRPLMVRRPSGTFSLVLEDLNPEITGRIIEIGSPEAMLAVGEAVGRGEFVAVLADRAVQSHKTIPVPFLGREAAFPTGPFIIAAALGAPVILCFGLRLASRHYRVVFEPFADRVALPRGDREVALKGYIARFAVRLGELCRAHPYNWFNFYPFWTKTDAAPRS